LDGLPWNEWFEGDRNDLVNALNGANSKIEELLNAMNPSQRRRNPLIPAAPTSHDGAFVFTMLNYRIIPGRKLDGKILLNILVAGRQPDNKSCLQDKLILFA
jgi:hypothetical protein